MRPVVVSVGPLATADDNGIVEAQTLAAAGQLALNGALTDFAPNNIAQSQTLLAPGALALVNSRVYLAGNQYIVINSVGDDTGVTFTITGVALGNVGVTETIVGGNGSFVVSANAYSQIISIVADNPTADDVEVGTWTAATLDQPRRVLLTFVANEAGTDFVVTGTDRYGNPITDTVAGNASTNSTVQDFSTVTGIYATAALNDNVTVGTSDVAGSDWVRFDDWAPNYISIQCVKDGTVNYTLEYTLDDPNSATDPVNSNDITWVVSDDTDVVNATTSAVSNFLFAPTFARITLNSGDGSVRAKFLQSFGGV